MKWFALFSVIVVTILFFIETFFILRGTVTYVTVPDGTKIAVEIADRPEERERGLSGRESLADNQGMLFVFGEPQEVRIWMKEMKFSIDILWMRDGEVVWIVENAPVSSGEEVASYLPPVGATHVLELPAGFVSEHEIFPGDVLVIHGPVPE